MADREVILKGNKLPIKKFDLRMMGPNAAICIIAKRGSGKSVLTRELLNYFKDKIPTGMVIAPTDRMSCFYGKFIPDIYVHYEYRSDVIKGLLNRQEMMVEKYKEKKKKGKFVDPRAFVVMDDCLSSKGKWDKDEGIREIFMNGRHFKIVFILTMQFSLGLLPELRSNFDYIFLLGEDFINNQKRLYDNYAGMFPSFKSFQNVFKLLTEDYGCMVISNRGARADFLDKIFWYKANDDIQLETIGCEQYRAFHDANYNKEWRKKGMNDKFDIDKFIHDRKGEVLKVDKMGRVNLH